VHETVETAAERFRRADGSKPARHRGEHYTIEGMLFLPCPVQRPGVPV
jgi:alkanesulfonate monooxygenase SsuD/methylene tetrahydromethanopterin reductase-like flavin-dependent oxidoreductase (luciferase family)